MKTLHNFTAWWKYEARYYPKQFVNGIRNLWKWFLIVWKDRDYDHTYIYKILQFKLEQQAFGIGSRNRHKTSQRDAELMLLCARLCYVQIEEGYENEYMDYVKQKHEFIATDETKKWYTVDTTIIEDNLDEYFKLHPRQYKHVMQGKLNWQGSKVDLNDRKEIAMCIAWNNQQRSKRLLFKILEEQIGDWWD